MHPGESLCTLRGHFAPQGVTMHPREAVTSHPREAVTLHPNGSLCIPGRGSLCTPRGHFAPPHPSAVTGGSVPGRVKGAETDTG